MSKSITQKEEDVWDELNIDETHLQNLLDKPLDQDTSHLRDGEQHNGFDNNVGNSWIYPSNLPCRSYQMSIVQAALYNNTLVVLPTGLGKTFIAAVVMYNFYRWYPRGKVIFLAPTRPLVHQQIEACQTIMPFPKRDSIELTGKLQRNKRADMWKAKRVFFATPQVVQSDIFGFSKQQAEDGTTDGSSLYLQETDISVRSHFPYEQIKLIVIDEAHKAKGKYAYTEVVRAIFQRTKYFRVLALSATPGRTLEDVAEVCRNLFISHIEVRWDTSIDVLPYVHKKTMDIVVVTLGEKIKEIREQLLQIVDPYLRQLTEAEILTGSLTNINRNFLLYEQKRYRERSLHMGRHPQHSAISSNFAVCISLYHALDLLERHGLRVFLNNFEGDEDGKDKFVLQIDRRLRELVENLKLELGPNPFDVSAAPMTNGKIADVPRDLDFGHPKFEKAREYLIKHFENNKESRAIVFCEYRESVMLIYRLLLQHTPLLRPRCFVGQGGTTGALRALTQKQQMQIMNDFRTGKSNILIATSIGEEGIDVGEVELIVCFDISTSNPTRFVQRIGRTGRKKNGHVIMLVTEGKEQQLLREAMSNKDQTNKKLLKSNVVQQSLYKHAPRLVPTEFKPKCVQTFIKPPSDDEDETVGKKLKKTASKRNKTSLRGSQDLRKFFNQKSPQELVDKDDLEFFDMNTNLTQVKPGLQTQQKIISKLDKMKNLFHDLQAPIVDSTQKQKVIEISPGKKLNTSQGSIKDYFVEANKTSLNATQENCLKDSLTDCKSSITIDLCDEESSMDIDEHNDETNNTTGEMDPEHVKELRKFLQTTWTTPKVLKRANINDLAYHLKSPEMSTAMKRLLLKYHPQFIKENLEQMQALTALHDNDEGYITDEEKSIREVNAIILELFGGREKVEEYLQEVEIQKFKQKCLNEEETLSEEEEEEDDDNDLNEFRQKLDNIFQGLGDGQRHDNYDWIQERFQQTSRYKELMNIEKSPKQQQSSMVYDTLIENVNDGEASENNFEDYSITESKYCSQWQEFNKPLDKVFKSTPLQCQAKTNVKSEATTKKTSLLDKLEEIKEGEEEENIVNKQQNNCKQLNNSLKILDTTFRAHSLLDIVEAQNSSSHDDDDYELEELEKSFKAKREAFEKKLSLLFEDLNTPDDEEILRTAAKAEAELKVKTQLPDDKLKQKTEKTNLQYELDIDMEAFMEPFPEEKELMKSSFSKRRESLKENLLTSSSFVRESPDLFAEEHMKSPALKKPVASKQTTTSLVANLTSKVNCMSFKSPHKLNKTAQNPSEHILLHSPSTRSATDKQKYEKSPSLFDMYLQSTKGKGKLPKSLSKSSSSPLPHSLTNNRNKADTENVPSIIAASQQNESFIAIRKRKPITSKRKIFDSDSDDNEKDDQTLANTPKSKVTDDSDFEEVTATQGIAESSINQKRRKRKRFHSLIEHEAAVTGSDHSEDETEHSNGCYLLDSIIVNSDDDDPDQASTSHMQAMYLQSTKSPQQKRGGTFKIPAPRIYNDHSRIFSQPVLPADTYSQYQADSFVVNEEEEDESFVNSHINEVSICPLERAENILKERRKAKKLQLLEEAKSRKIKLKQKTRIKVISDSSEEDNNDFE